MDISVVICTYDRAASLRRALTSVGRAARPQGCRLEVLVVDNGCRDDSAAVVEAFRRDNRDLDVKLLAEPTVGKSYALNNAIGTARGDVFAFVDDDHIVSREYLVAVHRAVSERPEYSFFCGRVLPAWDGREPAWVHDTGRYRIRPFPIPTVDLDDAPLEVTLGMFLAGGGNLVVRREVFKRVGRFSVHLGPRGHNLSGGEDTEFVMRALARGERLLYVPSALHYHEVDPRRLTLSYVMKKAFLRSMAGIQLRSRAAGSGSRHVPRYLYRQAATCLAGAAVALDPRKRRYYLVRLAATVGEISGWRRGNALWRE